MDANKYEKTIEEIYRYIDVCNTSYRAGNLSIQTFFENIKIKDIEKFIKKLSQVEDKDKYAQLAFEICYFYSQCQNKDDLFLKNSNSLQIEIAKLKEFVDNLMQELNQKSQEIKKITKDNESLKHERDTEYQKIKEQIEENSNQRIQELLMENAQYVEILNKDDSKLKKKYKESTKLIEENKNLKKSVDDLNKSISDLKRKNTQLSKAEKQVESLEKDNKGQKEIITSLKRTVESLKHTIDVKNSAIQKREKDINDLKRKMQKTPQLVISQKSDMPISVPPQSKTIQLTPDRQIDQTRRKSVNAPTNPYNQKSDQVDPSDYLQQQNEELWQKNLEKDGEIADLKAEIESLRRKAGLNQNDEFNSPNNNYNINQNQAQSKTAPACPQDHVISDQNSNGEDGFVFVDLNNKKNTDGEYMSSEANDPKQSVQESFFMNDNHNSNLNQNVQFYLGQISAKDNEIKDYKNRIKALEEQNEVNSRYIEELKSQSSQSDKKSQLKDQIKALQKTVAEKETQYKTLYQDAKTFRQAALDKTQQIQDLVKKYNDLKYKNDQNNSSVVQLQNEIKARQNLESQIASQKQYYENQIEKQKQNNESKISSLKQDYDVQIATLKQRCVKEIADLQQKCEKQIESLKQSNEKTIEKLNEDHKKQTKNLNIENEKLKNEVQNAEKNYGLENKSLNFIGQEQEKLILKLEEEIKTQNADLDKIRLELNQKTTDIENLTNDKKQLEEKVSQLSESNLSYENKVKEITEENGKLTSTVADLEKNKDKLTKMIQTQKEIINKQMILAKNETENQLEMMRQVQENEIRSIIRVFDMS